MAKQFVCIERNLIKLTIFKHNINPCLIMKEKLKELKYFRNDLNPASINQFAALIESLKEGLSEPYKSKLDILDLYNSFPDDKEEDDDDLPF